MRTTTLAPALAASGATTRASPPGAGSPFGSCLPPGAICTNVFGCSGSTRLSAGIVAVSSPYRPPEATWVTGRNGWLAFTTSVDGEAAGGRAGAADEGTAVVRAGPATATAATASWAATLVRRLAAEESCGLPGRGRRQWDVDISALLKTREHG